MKILLVQIVLLFSLRVYAQEVKEPLRLPLIPYAPKVAGVDQQNRISFEYMQTKGLKILLADSSFKVIQFDVIFDCHSRSLTDFGVRRYFGNAVPTKDEHLCKMVLAGDVMDIENTVVEKAGIKYRMKGFSFLVIN